MKKRTFLVILVISLGFAHTTVGAPGDLIRTFNNPALTADDGFGHSVLAVGNDVLGGAPFVDIPGAPGDDSFAGRAYLLDGSTGNVIHTFAGEGGGMFGFPTVVVDGNILISAFHDNTNATSTGAVYLFDGATGNQLPQSPILNPTPENYDEFGYSVAVVDGNIIVGADDSNGGSYAGAVYLVDGLTGSLLRTFQKPTPVAGDRFGKSVAAFGSNILVGATGDDTAGTNAGAVYLLDSSSGDILQTFLNPTPANGDSFGCSIAVLDNTIVIGAKGNDAGATNAGAVYLFDALTGNQLPQSPILNPTPENYDYFGEAIAIAGGNILIGARGDQSNGNAGGATYLFNSSTGNLLLTFLNPTPESGDNFGYSVAAMENNILIGAPYDDSGTNAGGALYLFEGYPLGDFEPDGDVDFADLAVLVSAWLTDEEDGAWDPACDIYSDGFIDMFDFAVFAKNWLTGVE